MSGSSGGREGRETSTFLGLEIDSVSGKVCCPECWCEVVGSVHTGCLMPHPGFCAHMEDPRCAKLLHISHWICPSLAQCSMKNCTPNDFVCIIPKSTLTHSKISLKRSEKWRVGATWGWCRLHVSPSSWERFRDLEKNAARTLAWLSFEAPRLPPYQY